MQSFEAGILNTLLKGELIGNPSLIIEGAEQIDKATANNITFIGKKAYLAKWKSSKASVAIITKELAALSEPGTERAFIVVDNVDLAMAKVLDLFTPEGVKLNNGIHATACVQPTATISEDVIIGAHCYIGEEVVIGKGVVIFPNTTILDKAVIGDNTMVRSGTVIAERCVVGSNCIIHSNATIGTDGFGYLPSPDGRGVVKINHIGNVVIGNNVEIGAATCIDRGKFGSTTIGDGTKIDNLVQIGHNCIIGRSCLIAGSCGISGSVVLGDGVIMGGRAGIADHITIGTRAMIGAGSGVIRDVPDGKTVLGYPAAELMKTRRNWAILNKLSEPVNK